MKAIPALRRLLPLAAAAALGATGLASAVIAANPAAPAALLDPEAFPILSRVRAKIAELNLDSTQKSRIKSVLQAHKPLVQPLVTQLVTERRALREIIRSGVPNESAVRAQSAKIATLQADLAVQANLIASELKPVLTPEQTSRIQQDIAALDQRVDTVIPRIFAKISE